MEYGQRFRMIKAHHAMNPILRDRVGDEGVVLEYAKNIEQCRVKFDKSDQCYGMWWIRPKYLEFINTVA